MRESLRAPRLRRRPRRGGAHEDDGRRSLDFRRATRRRSLRPKALSNDATRRRRRNGPADDGRPSLAASCFNAPTFCYFRPAPSSPGVAPPTVIVDGADAIV